MSLNEARQYQSIAPQRRRSEPAQQPKKLVKVKTKGLTVGEKLLGGIFGISLSVFLIYMVSFSANIDTVNRQIQSLEREITEQQTVNDNLRHQVMDYSNPERILSIAKANGLNIQNTQVKQAAQINE
ncbi:cell division protein FtsL [Amphibacillus marinus]|uniref:Cell division protein FtsL n=1 Tax=Amphibacillus marinus TaxID=872970 RepID=A0A1H8I456_9BACI|nr:cell division protein FtsL [Amphibacillus marinus]SEN63580.1 cell division protein FtsL [Amphibacillus marinus]